MNDIIRTLQFEKEQLEAKNRLLQEKIESDNRQISEYDAELRKAKELLKASVDGYRKLGKSINDTSECDVDCKHCPINNGGNCLKWRREDEALALIGKDIDVPATATNINVGGKEDGEQNG